MHARALECVCGVFDHVHGTALIQTQFILEYSCTTRVWHAVRNKIHILRGDCHAKIGPGCQKWTPCQNRSAARATAHTHV